MFTIKNQDKSHVFSRKKCKIGGHCIKQFLVEKQELAIFYCKNDEISPKSFLIDKKHHRDLAHPKPFCSKKVEL